MAGVSPEGGLLQDQQAALRALGFPEATWVLEKVLQKSDVDPGQNRLLLTTAQVEGSKLQEFIPEVGQPDPNKNNLRSEEAAEVKILSRTGDEESVFYRYLNSNHAYRIRGSGWGKFVIKNGLQANDRIDVWAGERGDGERCLILFDNGSKNRRRHGTSEGAGREETNNGGMEGEDTSNTGSRQEEQTSNGRSEEKQGREPGVRSNCNGRNRAVNNDTIRGGEAAAARGAERENDSSRNPAKVSENGGGGDLLSWENASTSEKKAGIMLLSIRYKR